MMPCFNSSRPSPVTEEILISSICFCLHHCCSFRTLAGSAASIFVATTIRGFAAGPIVFGSSFSMVLNSSTGIASSCRHITRCSRSACARYAAGTGCPGHAQMRPFDQPGNIGDDERLVLIDHTNHPRFGSSVVKG